MGFLGMSLQGEGMLGLNAVAYGLVELELEAGDSGLRSFVSVTSALAMYAILTFGSDEQRARVAPAADERRRDRLFRAERARLGQRPRLDAHVRQARRRRLGAQRHQDVDHERQRERRRDRVGQHRRRAFAGFAVPCDVARGSARPTSTGRCRCARA